MEDARLSLALALIAVVYLCINIQLPTVVSWWHARDEARRRARERDGQVIGPDDFPEFGE